MEYGEIERFQTGVAVPVASLRTASSGGIGEFADLVPFARWAADCGFDFVQILPVQDTAEDPSPYGAVSSAALHPVYLRLEEIEGYASLREEVDPRLAALREHARIPFAEVLRLKQLVLVRLFDRLDPAAVARDLQPWIAANEWVRPYAVFRVLLERNHQRSWSHWSTHQNPRAEDIDRFWSQPGPNLLFHAWVQREADRQLRAASDALSGMGVRLKGDIPILLNENSCDVWLHRDYFDLEGRAGAPPDMYSKDGQHWGFPVYDWEALARDDYAWWKRRLQLAARYFHAVRIDHVLGFFRIWRIPAGCETGMLGHFDPAVPLTREELHARGFDDARIAVLAAPDGDPNSKLPSEHELMRVENEEKREAQLARLWNRVLLPVGDDAFRPFWHWHRSPLFESLPEHERRSLGELLRDDGQRQEELWERTGRERLSTLCDATDMLVCAEDLGAVPACVPGVLRELGMLGLRVERWVRDWGQPDKPFVPPSHFERETVCSPGVHDASTLRAWWEEDEDDRRTYWRALGHEGEPPTELPTNVVEEILARNLAADSLLCVFALQDLMALDESLWVEDPADERINVPGTPSQRNWHYRMPVELEDLAQRRELRVTLRRLVEERRQRPLDGATPWP